MLRVLNAENIPYSLDGVPDQIDDIRYCVFDNTDPNDADFYFPPLIFMESFHSPAVCLKIGQHQLQIPMDWHLLVTDSERGEVDVMPITSLNNRGFMALVTNPLKNNFIQACEIEITDIYQDVKWYFPRLKHGHMLCVPMSDSPESPCILIVKEVNRLGEVHSESIVG
jgi:hypothetical protein